MGKYSKGICGAAILEDGRMMTVEEIVARLNELDREPLLHKYAICINDVVTQHVYSRVNSDAYSVWKRLVEDHRYNPEISVHFVACEIE